MYFTTARLYLSLSLLLGELNVEQWRHRRTLNLRFQLRFYLLDSSTAPLQRMLTHTDSAPFLLNQLNLCQEYKLRPRLKKNTRLTVWERPDAFIILSCLVMLTFNEYSVYIPPFIGRRDGEDLVKSWMFIWIRAYLRANYWQSGRKMFSSCRTQRDESGGLCIGKSANGISSDCMNVISVDFLCISGNLTSYVELHSACYFWM